MARRSKLTAWTNVPGKFTREFDADDTLKIALPMTEGELVIEFRSEGYYEPASMYGGSDNLGHPAEGSDERTLHEAYVLDEINNKIELDADTQNKLFDAYQEEIEKEDLDVPNL